MTVQNGLLRYDKPVDSMAESTSARVLMSSSDDMKSQSVDGAESHRTASYDTSTADMQTSSHHSSLSNCDCQTSSFCCDAT